MIDPLRMLSRLGTETQVHHSEADADVDRYLAAHEDDVKARYKADERTYKGVKPQLKLRQIFIAKEEPPPADFGHTMVYSPDREARRLVPPVSDGRAMLVGGGKRTGPGNSGEEEGAASGHGRETGRQLLALSRSAYSIHESSLPL